MRIAGEGERSKGKGAEGWWRIRNGLTDGTPVSGRRRREWLI